jgi:hypothetical protein
MSELIYRQHIWTVQRGSEGWRPISDRPLATANHVDHAHVSMRQRYGLAEDSETRLTRHSFFTRED